MTPRKHPTTSNREPIRFGEIEGESVAFIDLLHGNYAIVDVDCLSLVTPHRWYYNTRYVVAFVVENSSRRVIRMHNIVRPPKEGFQNDHRNRNPLDNRRSNLRDATNSQNVFNTRMLPANKSGFRGVCWHKRNNKWIAQSRLNGRIVHLGYFTNKDEAYAAYVKFNREQRGEFADGLPEISAQAK